MNRIPFKALTGCMIFTLCLYWIPGLAQEPSFGSEPDILAFQKEVVASLTGYNGSEITPRSTPAEREVTVNWLGQKLSKMGFDPQFHHYQLPNVNGFVDLLFAPYSGVNVYSILEATTESSDYIIIGAHYDSEPDTPGAVDNASGIAVTLALAGELSDLSVRDHNYLFVLFDQEEDDEVGSKAFVKYLEDLPFNIHSVHIIDSIGWGSEDIPLLEVQTSDPLIISLYRSAAERSGLTLNIIGGAGSSDNRSFNAAGYPTAGFWDEELTPHLHKSTDTYETVNFRRLLNSTLFLLEVLIHSGGK